MRTMYFSSYTLDQVDDPDLKAAEIAFRAQLEAGYKTAIETLTGKLTKLFRQHPRIKAFRWRQYTPTFNDGDPCRFGIYFDGVALADRRPVRDPKPFNPEGLEGIYSNDYDDPWDEWDYIEAGNLGSWDRQANRLVAKRPEHQALVDDLQAFSYFLQLELTERALEYEFGDHVEITVTRAGYRIKDYFPED